MRLPVMETTYSATGGELLPLQPFSCRPVCVRFFTWALGVSRNKVYQPGREYDLNVTIPRARKIPSATPSEKEHVIVDWLSELAKLYQVQPDSKFILLPFGSRAIAYHMYNRDREVEEKEAPGRAMNLPEVSLSWFRHVWRTRPEVYYIRLRRNLRFTKCDVCVSLREKRSATMDQAVIARLLKEEYKHYMFVKAERGTYYNGSGGLLSTRTMS